MFASVFIDQPVTGAKKLCLAVFYISWYVTYYNSKLPYILHEDKANNKDCCQIFFMSNLVNLIS